MALVMRASDGLVMDSEHLLDGANLKQCLKYEGKMAPGDRDVILPIFFVARKFGLMGRMDRADFRRLPRVT